MRLTIIPQDGFVSVDGVGYSKLSLTGIPQNIHAVQWNGDRGEVEFIPDSDGTKPQNLQIESITQFNDAVAVWSEAHDKATTYNVPTDEQKLAECVFMARGLLQESDWTQLQDVLETLKNKDEFDAYRAKLRSFLLTPVLNPEWPAEPKAVWG